MEVWVSDTKELLTVEDQLHQAKEETDLGAAQGGTKSAVSLLLGSFFFHCSHLPIAGKNIFCCVRLECLGRSLYNLGL